MLAAELGGVVSHASAAQLMGVGLVHAPDRVDLTVLRGSHPRPHSQARIHWARRLDESEVENGLTVPVRTALDCATSLPFADALAVADGLLSMSYLREKDLLAAAYASRGRGRAARIRVAEAADRRAENAFESALRALVLEAGVGGFVPQVRIRLPRRVVFADLADVERRLVLEADSFEHHGSRGALVRDCDRYNDLVAAGWHVLRFPWENVMLWPDHVTAVLVETCARLDAQRGRFAASRPPRRT
jgi:very-short-patch-repair endonuclease